MWKDYKWFNTKSMSSLFLLMQPKITERVSSATHRKYWYKTKITKVESRRTKINNYYLTVDSHRFLVCKNMFLSTVGISERAARTAVSKVLVTGVLEQQKRSGRQSEEVKSRDGLIRESINNSK